MPRTTIAAQTLPGGYITDGTVVAATAADVANGNQTVLSPGKTFIEAINSHATTTYTVTFTGAAIQPYGLTPAIAAVNLTAGQRKVFGPFPESGWMQSGGYLYYAANNAAILFSPFNVP